MEHTYGADHSLDDPDTGYVSDTHYGHQPVSDYSSPDGVTGYTDPYQTDEGSDAYDPASSHPDLSDVVDGNPSEFQQHWFYQEQDGLCGPSSAAEIVSEYTGLDIKDPQVLEQRAEELGLFANGDPSQGMTLDNLQTLLDDQGVPCHTEQSDMSGLEDKLNNGYPVIAFVDAEKIWGTGDDGGQPDHVVVVAGVDETKGVVYLSDPGNPNGNMEEVPIDQFDAAWATSDHEMLVPDNPDPNYTPPSQQSGPQQPNQQQTDQQATQQNPWSIIDLRG